MSQLVPATHRIIPRREPHLNSFGDRPRITQLIPCPKASQHDQKPQKHSWQPLACNGIKHQQSTRHDQRWTKVSLKKEKEQCEPSANENRHDISKSMKINALQDKRQSVMLFLEFAQQFPSVSKVASQKEHQENLDNLDRLKAEEIDLGIAGTWTRARENQNH